MPVAVYPALITGDQSAGYHAELVDFPGASVTEASSADLLRVARERLLRALRDLEAAGEAWPTATPVEALSDRIQTTQAILLLVDIQVEETPVRVNISIGDRLLRQLDDAAEAQNMTRSGFIAAAVRQRLGTPGAQAAGMNGLGSQRLFEEVAEVGRRVNEALGPESAFGRAVAELDTRALDSLRFLADNVTSAVKRRGREGSSSNGDKP